MKEWNKMTIHKKTEMLQLDELSIPKEIRKTERKTIISIVDKIKSHIVEELKKPIEEVDNSLQKPLKCCLLLTYFLLEDAVNFERLLSEIRKEETKISEQEQLYFDSLLLQSKSELIKEQRILNKIEYDRLLKAYSKWHLLIPNLISIRYKTQLKKIKESDWNLSPKSYLLLLELFIDWFYRLPAKDNFLHSIEHRLSEVQKEVKSFWDLKRFDLSSIKRPISLTRAAVWDTGIDVSVIKNVSKNIALYYDKKGNPTQERLMPLKNITEADWTLYQGFLDLRNAKKSDAFDGLLKELSRYKEADIVKFRATINQFRLHSHGTVVASVLSQENPSIEIIPIRNTFDMDSLNLMLFTPERIEKELTMHESITKLIQQHKIGIVNMSWNHRKRDVEDTLSNTSNLGKEAISILATKLFTKLRMSLYDCIKNCTNTLFISGAGNDNNTIEEESNIPCSFNLPNLITIGAVNYKGRRTDFTTIGKNVQLYANGSYVDTIMPKGYKSKSSGTSIAAPQVANVAAVMLSICPTMTPILIKKYLLANADRMMEEDILVINPKRTIEKTLLLAEKKTKNSAIN